VGQNEGKAWKPFKSPFEGHLGNGPRRFEKETYAGRETQALILSWHEVLCNGSLGMKNHRYLPPVNFFEKGEEEVVAQGR